MSDGPRALYKFIEPSVFARPGIRSGESPFKLRPGLALRGELSAFLLGQGFSNLEEFLDWFDTIEAVNFEN